MNRNELSATNNFIDTQKCSDGYTDARCAACSDGFYQLQGQCFYCGSTVDQEATIALTIIVGCGIIFFLAGLVAALPSMQLARALQIFALAQGAAAVSVSGARSSPWFKQELMSVVTYLNLINFGQCRMQLPP